MKASKKRKLRLEARQEGYDKMIAVHHNQAAIKLAYHRPGSLKK